MKGIVKKATAVVLAVTVTCGAVMGISVTASAASLSAGALQYGADFSFLEGLFMSAGAGALGLDMLLKTKNDINNWDWGEVLDDPATQGQIDNTESKINEWYDNAVKDWYKNHGGSSEPTPTPGTSPPVTVAPINPDDLDIPEDWATLKKNATDNGLLAMGAATAYCVKEAVKGWWDDILGSDPAIQYTENPYAYKDLIGSYSLTFYCEQRGGFSGKYVFYLYDTDHNISNLVVNKYTMQGNTLHDISTGITSPSKVFSYYAINEHIYNVGKPYLGTYKGTAGIRKVYPPSDSSNVVESINLYVPYTIDGIEHEAQLKPLGKSSIWPSTDLKGDYDNNRSPNFPELATPTLRLPSLDEIKDLWKQGTDDEDNRPTYVTNFIINHTVQATPTPEPTKKPDAQPTPTIAVVPDPGGGTDPDPEPTPSTTPAVVPDPGGGTDPQPSGSPNPNPDPGGGGDTDPDNPETPTPEEEASPYKADLREIFPFCIPFDLIHLLKVFDAEAEAPVFEFPLDIEMNNPWTGEKVVDYHHTFELDMADYEPVIKILRIFQVIFFIIALMLITRQQMIKG